jgi:TolB-like protein
VEGSPIDDYCDRHKLHIDERLQLFCKVCEAVEYAHEKSIVHRDLKPSNILVTADGIPRLLDFGLAKVLNPQPAAQSIVLTHTGTRCMTPAYASPEQMRGKSITTATDVYSLGVVLYELLTGHRPYRLMQHSPAEMERAICEQEPETPSTAVRQMETETCSDGTPIVKTPELVSETREGEPDKLQRRLRGDLDNIVLKALQKEPERRYGSVKELVLDIERHLQHLPIKARRSTLAYRSSKFIQRHKAEVGTGILGAAGVGTTIFLLVLLIGGKVSSLREVLTSGHGSPAIDSLAVLPVETIHGDQNAELLSDGITDSLINSLSRIPNLKVMSHSSVFHYKGKDVDPQEAGKTLKVKAVLTGRLTQRGDQLFLSTELIDVTDNKHLWGDEYERKSSAILPLQEELAQTIAGKLTAKLSPEQKRELARQPTSDPYAYALYTKGRYYMDKRTVDDFKRSLLPHPQPARRTRRLATPTEPLKYVTLLPLCFQSTGPTAPGCMRIPASANSSRAPGWSEERLIVLKVSREMIYRQTGQNCLIHELKKEPSGRAYAGG